MNGYGKTSAMDAVRYYKKDSVASILMQWWMLNTIYLSIQAAAAAFFGVPAGGDSVVSSWNFRIRRKDEE